MVVAVNGSGFRINLTEIQTQQEAQGINSVQDFFSIWTQMEVVLMTGVILAQVRGTFVLKSLWEIHQVHPCLYKLHQ